MVSTFEFNQSGKGKKSRGKIFEYPLEHKKRNQILSKHIYIFRTGNHISLKAQWHLQGIQPKLQKLENMCIPANR